MVPGWPNRRSWKASFNIDRGRIFGFLGPSGAGKSTVQNIMIGLLPVQKGKVLYDNKRIASLGKVFKLSGLENLKYYGGLFNVPTITPERLLEMVGLAAVFSFGLVFVLVSRFGRKLRLTVKGGE